MYLNIFQSGKITLHLLFGWSLDKDKKSLDQSKQFSWKFGVWTYHFFCTKHKIIENEKWKLLETLQYTIKEFNNDNEPSNSGKEILRKKRIF